MARNYLSGDLENSDKDSVDSTRTLESIDRQLDYVNVLHGEKLKSFRSEVHNTPASCVQTPHSTSVTTYAVKDDLANTIPESNKTGPRDWMTDVPLCENPDSPAPDLEENLSLDRIPADIQNFKLHLNDSVQVCMLDTMEAWLKNVDVITQKELEVGSTNMKGALMPGKVQKLPTKPKHAVDIELSRWYLHRTGSVRGTRI
ncbi:hypothetical protein EDC01DRAFT_635863 [Geopyxis carbonaria]|nr:hypothetical protein EDC01DRAFT_635863 [Geopyxis carbonaria]